MLTVGLTGFFTSLSLILAIGAQNTMLLRQGLTKQHIFWSCLFCSLSDAILIIFGIFGFNFAASKIPNLAFFFNPWRNNFFDIIWHKKIVSGI